MNVVAGGVLPVLGGLLTDLVLDLFGYLKRLGSLDDIHPVLVELRHASREVQYVKAINHVASNKVGDLEVEPVGVSASIGVNLHEQVVLVARLRDVVDVDRVQVAALKVSVEAQNVLLVDVLGNFCVELTRAVVYQVTRRLSGLANFVLGEIAEVLTRLRQAVRLVALVDLVLQQLRVVFDLDSALRLDSDATADLVVLFLHALILFVRGRWALAFLVTRHGVRRCIFITFRLTVGHAARRGLCLGTLDESRLLLRLTHTQPLVPDLAPSPRGRVTVLTTISR